MQRDSGVVDPRAVMTGFNSLPVELHHEILCFMDPEDILTLRKTCKYFFALTQQPRLWTTVYYRMRKTYILSWSRSEFAAQTALQCERLLVGASKTEKLFQTSRGHIQKRIFPDGQTRKPGPLTALHFLSERYILSVDDTTVVYIWDISKLATSAEAPSFPCARLTLVDWHFVTYSMSIDHSTLYVVASTDARAHIFTLSLPTSASDTDEPKLSFDCGPRYFDTRSNKILGIDVDSCLVLLKLSNTMIEVLDWRTHIRARISLREETDETISTNYIYAVRVCGPYLLCFRRLSINAYPIPLQFLKPEFATERPLPTLEYTIDVMCFSDGMSLSRVRSSRYPSGEIYSICVLTEATFDGTFHFVVHVRTTPEPQLSVRLLSFGRVRIDGRISARALGTNGFRGVWVKPNLSGGHSVVAFTTHPSQSPFDSNGPVERSLRFDEQIVSVVSSQDSDGDVTRCAVSEFTGRIALGSRTGAITLV